MLYSFSYSAGDGWIYTAGHPVVNDEGEILYFMLVDVKQARIFKDMLDYALKVGLPLLLAAALLAWLVTRHIRRTVARPIDAIAGAAQAYVQDRRAGAAVPDHFSPLHINTGDELENLSNTMADMEKQLTQHEEHITRITAEKERINTELSMASKIQASMLPDTFPAFPTRRDFDIYATMDPAKEVGGDFYDFFLVDDDHLAIVIADVSGKGVPAALFMMITKIIIQNHAMMPEPPGRTLTDANTFLCNNNRMDMFVTAWVGVLELSTGRLRASSAGHEYPAFYRASDGKFELLRGKHGFVLGGMEGMNYKEYELRLEKGDKLFVYTDGVPEATNAENEMFGTDRMIASLNRTGGASLKETLGMVRADVDAFVGHAEQFDDLTMLCVEYRGPQGEGRSSSAS